MSRDKELEIVYDFSGDKSIIKSLYQEKSPNRLDAEKTIKRMQDLNCNVLIVPTLRTLAEQPDPCREIMVALYEADIRLISPFLTCGVKFRTAGTYQRMQKAPAKDAKKQKTLHP